MPEAIKGIIQYDPEPDPEETARKSKLLWLFAAISLTMMVVGYVIIVFFILK